MDSEQAYSQKKDGCSERVSFCDQCSSAEICTGTLVVGDIYINDLDVNIDGSISKFADTKITGITEYISDCQSIQRDIDQPVMGREMAEGD